MISAERRSPLHDMTWHEAEESGEERVEGTKEGVGASFDHRWIVISSWSSYHHLLAEMLYQWQRPLGPISSKGIFRRTTTEQCSRYHAIGSWCKIPTRHAVSERRSHRAPAVSAEWLTMLGGSTPSQEQQGTRTRKRYQCNHRILSSVSFNIFQLNTFPWYQNGVLNCWQEFWPTRS